MKLFAFVDVHARVHCIQSILKASKHADLLICAGDLSNFGMGLEKMALLLRKVHKPVLMVHGNHEQSSDIDRLAEKFSFIVNIHKRCYRTDDVAVIGYGGGGFAFEDTSMERYFAQVRKKIGAAGKMVLVTHAPAYGKTVDNLLGLGHCGCISVNRGIKLLKPMYAIAGHIHETAGREDKLGGTLLLNPGCIGRMLEI